MPIWNQANIRPYVKPRNYIGDMVSSRILTLFACTMSTARIYMEQSLAATYNMITTGLVLQTFLKARGSLVLEAQQVAVRKNTIYSIYLRSFVQMCCALTIALSLKTTQDRRCPVPPYLDYNTEIPTVNECPFCYQKREKLSVQLPSR